MRFIKINLPDSQVESKEFFSAWATKFSAILVQRNTSLAQIIQAGINLNLNLF